MSLPTTLQATSDRSCIDSSVSISSASWKGPPTVRLLQTSSFVWDWKTGDFVKLLELDWPRPTHFTSGVRPSVRGREYIDSRVYPGLLPR